VELIRQILIPLALIACAFVSYEFEQRAFDAFFGGLHSSIILAVPMSVLAAYALNTAKFGLSYYINSQWSAGNYRLWISYSMVFLLSFNSAICSTMLVTASVDGANVEQVLFSKNQEAAKRFKFEADQLAARHDKARKALISVYKDRKDEMTAIFLDEKAIKDKELEAERKNVGSDGYSYIGEQYEKLAKQKEALIDNHKKDQAVIDSQQLDEERRLIEQQNKELVALEEKQLAEMASLSVENVKSADSLFSHDEYIVSTVRLFNNAVGINITPIQVILLVSLLIALLVEMLMFWLTGQVRLLFLTLKRHQSEAPLPLPEHRQSSQGNNSSPINVQPNPVKQSA